MCRRRFVGRRTRAECQVKPRIAASAFCSAEQTSGCSPHPNRSSRATILPLDSLDLRKSLGPLALPSSKSYHAVCGNQNSDPWVFQFTRHPLTFRLSNFSSLTFCRSGPFWRFEVLNRCGPRGRLSTACLRGVRSCDACLGILDTRPKCFGQRAPGKRASPPNNAIEWQRKKS